MDFMLVSSGSPAMRDRATLNNSRAAIIPAVDKFYVSARRSDACGNPLQSLDCRCAKLNTA
ncbi:MAG: hypothetical protein JNM29_04880 [Candidatus Odyssella sp.]|nr:hypothetical protein [Candidatus Odyssella sp.]